MAVEEPVGQGPAVGDKAAPASEVELEDMATEPDKSRTRPRSNEINKNVFLNINRNSSGNLGLPWKVLS